MQRPEHQVDLTELDRFAKRLVADVSENYPDLLDPVHGESKSLTPEDRLVPEALEARAGIRAQSAQAGYYAGFMPTSVGGAGWSNRTAMAAYEMLAKHPAYPQTLWPDLAIHVTGQAWGPVGVLLQGSQEVRDNYLAPLMTGELTSCTAITDPRAGSDPQNMYATATRKGSSYRIDGVKQFVGNSPYADLILFYARTSGNLGEHGGISLFVIESERPGVEISRIFPVMEGRGNHGEIAVDRCSVPAGNLVGEEGRGFWYLMEFIDSARLMLGAMAVGAAQWCLDAAVARAMERHTFGQPLSSRQGIRWILAELEMEILAARALIDTAARRLDSGVAARAETAAAKLLGPRIYSRAADAAMQVHGGYGFIADSSIERHYRRARGMRLYMGTDEMQKNTIAKTLF